MKSKPLVEFFTGDVAATCRALRANSFDACLCDPPYGLEFMGKGWDHGIPPADTWLEVFRVLKPGAFLLAFGGTRTYHRLACAIEDAGFELRDCLMWVHGQGFPKSLDISKAIDKAAGMENVVGTKPDRWTGKGSSLNFSTDRLQTECKVTAPATDAAKQWAGYGTALKPAWEPILVAMKPCVGTFAENALQHGVAGLNIDGCRIPAAGKAWGSGNRDSWRRTEGRADRQEHRYGESDLHAGSRWPANLILDEESAAELDRQSGISTSAAPKAARRSAPNDAVYNMGHVGQPHVIMGHGDSGGASRFFYCAKASRKERGDGNTHPTVKPLRLTEYLARLILPPRGGKLLVPFAGSGSEIIGARRAGWKHITGIEREPAYVRIATKRAAAA